MLYRRVVDAFSMRNWQPARVAGHDQFFDTFGKFDAVLREGRDASARLVGRGVAEIVHRAALQNVRHLELMWSFDSLIDVSPAGVSWQSDEDFPLLRERLLATEGFRQRLGERRRWLDAVNAETRAALGCATPAAIPGCDVSVRFIAYALRGLPPQQVFAQAMFAFELAASDPRIVGVNLVMPEDWFFSMRDYDLHMQMFRFFRQSYPGVNVALHAGELALGLVPPEKLGLHVRQAVEVGGAQRIGHGTDVMRIRERRLHAFPTTGVTWRGPYRQAAERSHPCPRPTARASCARDRYVPRDTTDSFTRITGKQTSPSADRIC